MKIFVSGEPGRRGGPQVWSERFCQALAGRGYSVTHSIADAWEAALLVGRTDSLDAALARGRMVGFRVANGYQAEWFRAFGLAMQAEHHAANAAIARGLELAQVVIYQSRWAKEQLDRFLYARQERFAVIKNGVDLERFAPAPSLPEGPPVIGAAGRMRYRYRLATVLEMSRRLRQPHRLLIVGSLDEECRQELRRAQADAALRGRITHQPFVAAEELPDLYRQMTLLAHPVIGDACPNVVVEALACGVPVVAPDFGGTAEVIGRGGVTFPSRPWDYGEAFVEAMLAAVEQALELAPNLALQARRQAEMELDIQAMTTSYLAALNLPPQASQASEPTPGKGELSLRQQAAQWAARPRFYTAVALRKARQLHTRLVPSPPNPRPRIAFTLFDFHVGGIENWLYRLASQLHDQFDFYFLATKVADFLPKFRQVGECAFLPSPLAMTSYLRRKRIDLVQVHNERWPVDAALAAGTPHVIERLGGPRSWRRVPKYGLDMVIASARMAAQAVADMLPAERIRVIYNGIDLEQVDSAACQRVFPAEALVIGRSSRFGRGQNLGLLVQALERLRPSLPELRLVFVGGDSLMPGATPVEAELRAQVQAAGLSEYVHFSGIVEDAIPYTHGFDIAACVSNDEGIPNSLIEAMACRKAVVATRVGAIPELVQHETNGLLIPAGDLGALCDAIQRLAQDERLRRGLGEAGRRTVEEKFSLPEIARQYADLYRQILGGPA